MLTLNLYGRFSVVDEEGVDRTPKSAKSQVLIALLATSDTNSRGRLWLQKKLWPDRERSRSSVSLRQALSEIRRAFGPHRDVLIADRRSVALNPELTECRPREVGQEFMEGVGLDASEHGLGVWLERLRDKAENAATSEPHFEKPAASSKPKIVFRAAGETPQFKLIEEIFVDGVVRSLHEAMSVDIYTSNQMVDRKGTFRVEIQAYPVADTQVGLRARVYHGEDTSLVWAGMTSTQLYGAPPVEDLEIVALGNQLIDALADALTLQVDDPRDIRDSNLLIRLAVRRIFRMRPEALSEADAMLATAHEAVPRGLSAAWRAQLRVIQEVERHANRSNTLSDEAAEYAALAMEMEPLNSMVLTAVANARLVLDQDIGASNELARRSVELNPSNPLAWDALSTAKLYAGEINEAHALAVRAQKISSGSPFGFWWDFGRCLTAALTGRGGEALRLAEASHAMSPEFRPPLRYLTALYAANDQPDAAIRVADKLRRLEPDFTFDRMANDREYPISPLRWSGLLDGERLMALG